MTQSATAPACNCDASGDPPTGHRPWCGTEPATAADRAPDSRETVMRHPHDNAPASTREACAASAMSARSRRARIARAARRLYWRALPFCFPCDRHTLRGHRHADATFSALASREWRA